VADTQFRVLYRQFLFRVVDLEILSSQGETSKLLGQFASLLVFVGLIFSISLWTLADAETPAPQRMLASQNFLYFLIATTMLAVGLFAVLSWDSTLPDQRDVLVLAPLPVRASTIFLAKVSAMATGLAITVTALDGLAAIPAPLVFAPLNSGLMGMPRSFAAYLFTMFAAGAFIFCCVLGAQGAATLVLPRRTFLRLSSVLQIGAFCLFVCVYFLEPSPAAPGALTAAQNHYWLTYSPSYWFLGVFQQLNGSMQPAFAPLALHAWLGLAVAGSAVALVYSPSYFRTLRRIAEEPDIVPRYRHMNWLPRLGSSLATAIGHFSIRTLLRSRKHRLILAFYLAVGFALTILFVGALPALLQEPGAGTASDLWHHPNAELVVPSVMMMIFGVIGTRIIFAMPLDLGANWTFRIAPLPGLSECMAASRRTLLLLAVAPIWTGWAVVYLWLWPWLPAVGHVLVFALLGIVIAEMTLAGFHKIPFTCSYLPGKSKLHLAFWGCTIVFGILLDQSVILELRALRHPVSYAVMMAILVTAAILTRRRTEWLAVSQSLRFEEIPEPAVLDLGLHRS
jgi:hypothetical protein